MDKSEIESIINQSIKRLQDEYELLNTTMLNALHQNIDILMNNSSKWFGDDIPDEFRGVLTSLMTITYLYFQEKGTTAASIAEPHYEEFRPDLFLTGVLEDIEAVFRIKNIDINIAESETTIRTSRKILRDSLYNIFLSISQFMSRDSRSRVQIFEESTAIRFSLGFHGLDELLPDTNRLSKVFFSFFDGNEYHIRVGLNVALENLRNIGINAKMERNPASRSLAFTLSIPTTHFLETIDDIRRSNMPVPEAYRGEEIGLSIDDIIIEMVLRDTLAEKGYSPVKTNFAYAREGVLHCKKIIADCDSLKRNNVNPAEIPGLTPDAERIIIIYGDNDDIADSGLPARIILVKKPFDVEALISHLQ